MNRQLSSPPPLINSSSYIRVSKYIKFGRIWWRRGVAVERRTRDREVAGSSLGRALRRKNSGQVSHT